MGVSVPLNPVGLHYRLRTLNRSVPNRRTASDLLLRNQVKPCGRTAIRSPSSCRCVMVNITDLWGI